MPAPVQVSTTVDGFMRSTTAAGARAALGVPFVNDPRFATVGYQSAEPGAPYIAALSWSPGDGWFVGDAAGLRAAIDVRSSSQSADMPRVENRQALRDFFAGLHAFSLAPSSTRRAIAYYGDSVSSHVSEEFIREMFVENFPRADLQYPSAMQAALTFAVTGTPLAYNGSARAVNQNVLDGTGGFVDFTYLPSGEHLTLANGSVVTFDAGQMTGFNEVRSFYATGPGMGSVFVELINRDTSAVIASTSQNLSDASLSAMKIAFTGISETTKYRLRITATGTVVHLHTAFLKPAGIMPLNFGRGGSTLAQNNFADPTIFQFIANDLGTCLIFLQAKEENPSVNIPPTMTRLGLLTSASKFVIGSLPDVTNAASQIATNAIFRANAIASGYAYFDGYAAFGGVAELQRLGWIPDGVHPLAPANRYVAGLIHGELDFLLGFSGFLRRNVDHRGLAGAYVATGTVRVFTGGNGEASIDVITNAGGGEATRANLRNIRNIFFDADGSTRAYIQGRDSGTVAVINTAGQPGTWWGNSVQVLRADEFAFSADNGGIRIARDFVTVGASGRGVRYGSTSGPLDTYGAGSPEGVLAAPVGSTYRRTDGGAGTTFYVKESGTGNTGWAAK